MQDMDSSAMEGNELDEEEDGFNEDDSDDEAEEGEKEPSDEEDAENMVPFVADMEAGGDEGSLSLRAQMVCGGLLFFCCVFKFLLCVVLCMLV